MSQEVIIRRAKFNDADTLLGMTETYYLMYEDLKDSVKFFEDKV